MENIKEKIEKLAIEISNSHSTGTEYNQEDLYNALFILNPILNCLINKNLDRLAIVEDDRSNTMEQLSVAFREFMEYLTGLDLREDTEELANKVAQ